MGDWIQGLGRKKVHIVTSNPIKGYSVLKMEDNFGSLGIVTCGREV